MTGKAHLLTAFCALALTGCVVKYKLISEGEVDGGAGQTGGDGDGDTGGTGVTGGAGGSGDGDGDGDGNLSNACRRGGRCQELRVTNTDKVDVLFMVDNSASMEQEQASLREQLPRFIQTLTTGDVQGDGVQDFPPAKDLHIGVVTSDLGLPGLESQGIDHCVGLGDRGELNNQASPELAEQGLCSALSYNPPFIAYESGGNDDPTVVANDAACVTTVGLDGCGFEQPLESTLKALWPANDQDITFVTDTEGFGMFGNAGPGFPNGDFARRDSLLSIVMVTDEDDCSSRRMDHFIPGASPNGLNTRCYYEGLKPAEETNLFQLQRYIELFKFLRPGREDLVMFSAIVGIPERLVSNDVLDAVDFENDTERDAFYEDLLIAPELIDRIDDKQTPDAPEDDNMVPSCDRGVEARAYPPRRIINVAKGMGANGSVHSICTDDFTQPITAILDRMRRHLGEDCLSFTLPRTNDLVACDVYWELPTSSSGSAPTRCDQLSFLTHAGPNDSGGQLCKVQQLRVVDGEVVEGSSEGFYYDDFSDDAEQSCKASSTQTRIAFTPEAQPPAGVNVILDCD